MSAHPRQRVSVEPVKFLHVRGVVAEVWPAQRGVIAGRSHRGERSLACGTERLRRPLRVSLILRLLPASYPRFTAARPR